MTKTTLDSQIQMLSDDEHKILLKLRQQRKKSHKKKDEEKTTPGIRVADAVAATVGSWRFIIIQSCLLVLWITLNVIGWIEAWDPFPFILLNLMLSFQAAYTAPVIMMSQNRQADIDRERAEDDYNVNLKAELEIELLHQKIDLLREQEIMGLTKLVQELSARK